jgi:uncharacterized protein YjdB
MKSSGRLERWAAAILAAAAVSCTDKDAVTAHPSNTNEHLTVSIDLPQQLVLVGTSTRLTARTTNQKGEIQDANISWTTSNSDVLTVDAEGTIAAVGAGSAQVIATIDGDADTALVEVQRTAGRLDVVPEAVSLALGDNIQLSTITRGVRVHGVAEVRWTSSDTSVAVVSAAGVVTGRGEGTAEIVATTRGASAKSAFVVFAASATTGASEDVSVSSIRLNLEPATIAGGQHSTANVKLLDKSADVVSGETIAFTSSDPDVATIGADGVVTGFSAGTATITASSDGVTSTASITVTARVTNVSDVARIDILVPSTTMAVGDTAFATARAYDASGAQVSVPIAWRSTNGTVLKVGLAAGSASIRAQAILNGVLGVSSTLGLTVQSQSTAAVATVSVSVSPSTIAVGQKGQASAVVKDAAGNVLTGRTITYSSSNTAVATVSTSGVVTALSAGTATISGVSGGKTGTAAVTVQTASTSPVASVTVNLSSSTLQVGQTTTGTAVLKDATGKVVTGSVMWKISSGASVASVSSSGLVAALAAGSATVTATSNGIDGSKGLSVTTSTATASASRIATRPTLPQNFVDISWKPKTGATINVAAGGNLQTALNNAKPGDEIVLAAGATFTGNFTLPLKSGSGWILVRTSGSLPPLGQRLTPSTAGGVARIKTNNQLPALRTAAGTRGWRFVGIEFGVTTNVTAITTIVSLGEGSTQTSLAQAPRDLVFDRVWVHGHPTLNVRRCIALNSAATAVISSTISECHDRSFDAQAIWGWNGPGPFHIENNYLEGSGENFGFGGAIPTIPNLVPSDIVLRRNHIAKPASWKTAGWLVKNLIEFKNARRVLIEENLIEGNWTGGQQGYAIVLTARSEGGYCRSWCVVEDVTFRWNHVRRTGSGLNLSGRADQDLVRPSTRFLFEQNLWEEINTGIYQGQGRIWLLQNDGLADVTFSHNTGFGTDMTVLYCNQEARVEIEDNIVSSVPGYGLWSCAGKLTGTTAVGYHVQNWTYLRNVTINVPAAPQPTGNFYTTLAGTAFVNAAARDWTLSSSSPFKGKGEHGTDPGVAFGTLKSKLNGVVVP